MSCGIYKITNKLNGHSYIGLSTNIEKRFSEHKSKAFTSNKKEDIDKVLYKAIRKYGIDNFYFEILEECPKEVLKEKEIYWIQKFNTYLDRNHYNETPGGDYIGDKNIHRGEAHGMSKLTTEEVIMCRNYYKEGKRSREIYDNFNFKEKISYEGFLRMWHGKSWKHIMPEVFETNPHKSKYTEKDKNIITELFYKSGLNLHQFSKTDECYCGIWDFI